MDTIQKAVIRMRRCQQCGEQRALFKCEMCEEHVCGDCAAEHVCEATYEFPE
jgi:hypothetical protein